MSSLNTLECPYCGAVGSIIKTGRERICQACGEIIKSQVHHVGDKKTQQLQQVLVEKEIEIATLQSRVQIMDVCDLYGEGENSLIVNTSIGNVHAYYKGFGDSSFKGRLLFQAPSSLTKLKVLSPPVYRSMVIGLTSTCALVVFNMAKRGARIKIKPLTACTPDLAVVTDFVTKKQKYKLAIVIMDREQSGKKSRNILKLFDDKGTLVAKYKIENSRKESPGPITDFCMGDFDGDGMEEIAVTFYDRQVGLINYNLDKDKFYYDYNLSSEAILGEGDVLRMFAYDIDNDFEDEVIVVTTKGVFYVYKYGYPDELYNFRLWDTEEVNVISTDLIKFYFEETEKEEVSLITFFGSPANKVKIHSLESNTDKVFDLNIEEGDKLVYGTVGDVDNDDLPEIVYATRRKKIIMKKIPIIAE